jgi:hypothetical protein
VVTLVSSFLGDVYVDHPPPPPQVEVVFVVVEALGVSV